MITNFSQLFDSLARFYNNRDAVTYALNVVPDYSAIVAYDSSYSKHYNRSTVYYDLNIPGCNMRRVYFINTGDDPIPDTFIRSTDGSYIIGLVNVDTKVLYTETANTAEVIDFLKDFRREISTIIPEESLPTMHRLIVTLFACFEVFYLAFNPDKDTTIGIQDKYNFDFKMSSDNKVYENFVNLIRGSRTTPITEAKVINAFRNGVLNVESGYIRTARLMPTVQ